MTKNDYTPAPVDTTNVQLPEELMVLAEAISKNVHEVWAQNRMNEGWTYGPVRDDEKRQTPCLVPYEELSELSKKPGFVKINWCGNSECEDKIKDEFGLKSRCIIEDEKADGKCPICNKEGTCKIYFGRQY